MFRFTVLRPVLKVLPFSSVATASTSRSFLNMPPASTSGSEAPTTYDAITTDAFGAGPLNTVAVTASGSEVSGTGLSSASFSSADGPSLASVVFVSGALPLGATYPFRARTDRPGLFTSLTSILRNRPSRLSLLA